MKSSFLDNLINPFGKYGYSIIGSLTAIIAFSFIFVTIYKENFVAGLVAFFFMFVTGYCWNKDSEKRSCKK